MKYFDQLFSRRKLLGAGTMLAASGIVASCSDSKSPKAKPEGFRGGSELYDAIVIGAGLSGLHAARLLEEQGLNVLTLEGRDRIGGRVYTLMDVPGKPEAAGEWIGGNYARMLNTARVLGLEVHSPGPTYTAGEKYYVIKGQNILAKDWPNHPLNPMTGDDREMLPDNYLFTLSNRNNPLSDKPLDDWIDPKYAKYDIPHSQYLKEVLGLNEETIRLMNVVIHAPHIDSTSALNELRRYAVGDFNAKMAMSRSDKPSGYMIKGGNSLITEAMAKTLKNGVLVNKSVHSFDDLGKEVIVECTDGTSYRGKQVVNTMPLTVMKNVKFTNQLPEIWTDAISQMTYGISMQMHFGIERNFWEDDGLPANIWTDQPFERFAVLQNGENGAASSAIAYVNGVDAERYSFMDDDTVMAYTMKKLEEVRPSLKGALKPLKVQSCHRDVHGAGDWMIWKAGQVGKFATKMREPHGNIHFAGEHTALMERGMEGAFESGERAAYDLLTKV